MYHEQLPYLQKQNSCHAAKHKWYCYYEVWEAVWEAAKERGLFEQGRITLGWINQKTTDHRTNHTCYCPHEPRNRY